MIFFRIISNVKKELLKKKFLKMKQINFMTIGDKNYFPFIHLSIKQITKFYPSSKIYIYDWGFTPTQKKKINSLSNTILINWSEKLDLVSGYKTIKRNYEGFSPIGDCRRIEYLLTQKPICMLDCAKRIKENLIFFDGDAMLINPIDEIFEDNYDIGVTIYNKDMLIFIFMEIREWSLINSGVIFFKLETIKMQLFIQEWIKEIKNCQRFMMEQTSLNSLIKGKDKDFLTKFYNIKTITLSNTEFKIKAFPASIYNFFRIYAGYDDKKVKFLHFIRPFPRDKSSPAKFVKNLLIEMKLRHIYFNFLKLFPLMLKNSIERIFGYRLFLYLNKSPLDFNLIRFVLFQIISNVKKENKRIRK